MGAQTEIFAACKSLPQRSGSEPLNFLYSLADNGNGTSTLRVAFDGAADGWVSWGIPTSGGGMLGSSVVVVKPAAGGSGATATPYLLADYDPATWREGGAWNVTALRAGAAKGRLQASFQLVLAGTPVQLTAAPLMIIYASGPVTSSGMLQPHRGRGFTTTVDLRTGMPQQRRLDEQAEVSGPAPDGGEAWDRTRTTGRLTRPLVPAPAPAPDR